MWADFMDYVAWGYCPTSPVCLEYYWGWMVFIFESEREGCGYQIVGSLTS
jgi:hypothetical protein